MLLFDLDGTLLRTDKTISKFTMQELERCREQGIMLGVSTSRSEKNSMGFIAELNPDVVISSAGALVKYRGTYIYNAMGNAIDEVKRVADYVIGDNDNDGIGKYLQNHVVKMEEEV